MHAHTHRPVVGELAICLWVWLYISIIGRRHEKSALDCTVSCLILSCEHSSGSGQEQVAAKRKATRAEDFN